jgi:hypothetical protein
VTDRKLDDEQAKTTAVKKAYRAPTLQVYGTLQNITQAVSGGTGGLDGTNAGNPTASHFHTRA